MPLRLSLRSAHEVCKSRMAQRAGEALARAMSLQYEQVSAVVGCPQVGQGWSEAWSFSVMVATGGAFLRCFSKNPQ